MKIKSSQFGTHTMSAQSYPGYCFGAGETQRRAEQIRRGVLTSWQPRIKSWKSLNAKATRQAKKKGEARA